MDQVSGCAGRAEPIRADLWLLRGSCACAAARQVTGKYSDINPPTS